MHLLIVDDDLGSLMAAGLLFRADGHQVTEAQDGAEALRLLKDQRFDVVLLDLMMPGVNGWQVLEEMQRRGDKTPVVVLSAAGGLPETVTGCAAVLQKPVDIEDLLSALRQAGEGQS